ncbi:hypothetical protein ACMX2H_17450 [Arthrobacter sulfonylureivorans]|uniref:hypothetical protein n=1 Tax=Arthrobacter sulfonylureivorans TaxID=2486855 RepID=UPI0039E6991D
MAEGNIVVTGGTSNVLTQAAPLPVQEQVLPTQSSNPWRATLRTVIQWIVGLAAMAPVIYSAIMQADPAQATGAAAIALGITAAITRVMALPQVNAVLELIGLGAQPSNPLRFDPAEADAGIEWESDVPGLDENAPSSVADES